MASTRPTPARRSSAPPPASRPPLAKRAISEGPALVLAVGDKVVHPAHGVGEVTAIEHRELGGATGDFYVLKILDNGLKIMVPKCAAAQAGLRAVMSPRDAEEVLETLSAREVAVDLQPWAKRFRAYTEMVASGLPLEIAKVMRDMYRLKFDKDLSFGERRLLDQAKSLLLKELALAKQVPEADLAAEVRAIFSA